MTPYEKAVSENLRAMGTPASEWLALEIKEMVNDGQNPAWPSYDYPQGYGKAPTLYPCTGQDACCELCGHPIKICYALKNDNRKWLLTVGSECVTHFGTGQSGKELASEKAKADKRQALRMSQVEAEKLDQFLRRPQPFGQLSWEQRQVHNDLHRCFYSLKKILFGYRADQAQGWRDGKQRTLPASTDQEVTGWYRARKEKVDKLLARITDNLNKFKALTP